VRERGVQSRRVRAGNVEPVRRSTPPSRNGTTFWQALAIVALIAATAGWTTVAVLALRGTGSTAVATDSSDPNAVDPNASDAPVAESHDAPELEALLPASLNGATFDIQSGLGDSILGADAFGTSMTSFLTGAGKTPADLEIAQASPTGDFDGSIGAYRVAGVGASSVRDALIQAWKGDTPGLVVSQVTLGGTTVTKADFGAETVPSYLYERDDVVFDIETTDPNIATAAIAAIAALPAPGSSAAPHPSATPSAGASAKPSAAASPAP
jgi:hypothetical protein